MSMKTNVKEEQFIIEWSFEFIELLDNIGLSFDKALNETLNFGESQ